MSENITTEAESTRQDLMLDPASGADSLIRFANIFAFDRKLRHRALLLKATFSDSSEQIEQTKLQTEMLALLDSIVADHEHPHEDVLRNKQAFDERLDQYQPVELDRSIVFECHNLGHTYRTGKPEEFRLHGVDLKLRLGEITGVVGENGNGKTTLFRMVVGELKHMEGTLCYPYLGAPAESVIDWSKVKAQIAYVPQSLAKWHGTLEENLRYAAATKGILGAENDREFTYVVERLGLGEYLELGWNELSGGFKLRFELARALIWKPKLLALDEPLANLDIRSQLTVLRDIRDLSRSISDPMAVLLSSQHLHEVEAIADDILFLTDGRVVYNGPIEGVGENRRQNMFELDCRDDISELREKLRRPMVERVSYNGMSFVVTTNRQLSREQFLEILKGQKVDFTYFRDISRSVKQLFESGEAV